MDAQEKGFPAVCSNCGVKCTVPFKPIPGRPVLCRSCYQESQGPGRKRAAIASSKRRNEGLWARARSKN